MSASINESSPQDSELHDPDTCEDCAVFAAVEAVLDKHLTSSRWQLSTNPEDPEDDEGNGWVGKARDVLAEVIESSLVLRWGSDPAMAERDFEDFRDFALWQSMLDVARANDGLDCLDCGCCCDCHNEDGVA